MGQRDDSHLFFKILTDFFYHKLKSGKVDKPTSCSKIIKICV